MLIKYLVKKKKKAKTECTGLLPCHLCSDVISGIL